MYPTLLLNLTLLHAAQIYITLFDLNLPYFTLANLT